MQRFYRFALVCALLLLAAVRPMPVFAQSVGVTVGSPGIGGEVGFDIGKDFGLRATASYFTLSHSISPSNITYDGHLQLLTAGAMGDFYLFNSGFRLSAGAMYDANHINVVGTPTTPVQIGATTYTAAQLGQLNGRIDFRNIAPYAGLGYASGRGQKGFAFTFDAGVMFAGDPRVSLAATGPATALPGFAANLESEREKIYNDVSWLRFTPLVKLGLLYRF